jgi:predicted DNA-binding transcriptional regulator YafY
MTFSADELEALVLGTRMVEAWGDTSLRQAARSIVDKVNAVVGDSERDQLSSSALFSLRFGVQREASKHLGELRQAINQRLRIRFRYQSEQGEGTERAVRPLGLYFWGRAWTLAAYCELRTDFRNFRSDRIADLELLDGFELVPPCTLEDYERAMQASSERAEGAERAGPG